ncbi:2-amino-4-hydroxy-6-hydroxymethyldihydropteridine diphosphokinase [Cocleimonas sp. KMM 6892]|jgi:2-amino-4-hydroxy-6-hydroxymethyldihydropteridine diphosphokinase|uniref:2-amino-4-hydroxy-6- hydroxymethyldihydropteridine diphosphokinase n=1 Tax=unclassified Cocleimonas TaxID=2639732 RepID=UPI002DB5D6C8|nr:MULTISPECIES: 2-amino-4-hydroxy-6-hydroxymethyldihydropteridine diphosphokinase [unclassified Cocleimonas]MEB8433433.1 2-amino-4-hydroxy-6-hydroxymethyldihydropteridine diphosphokinase [Cocleimonas sp. KMM 6892]MEC4716244.1 2-amino-4-hydroxy-6-hydroxymethyldihydropteridine diphosphokinase [Cocleimonas sp. KMM 6895]MEC4745863.1 2-amino-4-hydroxy-6-hydroxymethyldihydropteridine diphosphokinase [Cocleimonas sp. KMM 6896]
MVAVYIDIGSNIDREKNIQSCVDELQRKFPDMVFSKAYESASFGFKGDAFINISAGFETDLSYADLKDFLKSIENQHARKRSKTKFISRTLDVDVLLYGDEILRPDNDVPRAEILKFPFVLFPLAEIAAETIHPEQKKTIAQLAKESDLDKNSLTEVPDFPKLKIQ